MRRQIDDFLTFFASSVVEKTEQSVFLTVENGLQVMLVKLTVFEQGDFPKSAENRLRNFVTTF